MDCCRKSNYFVTFFVPVYMYCIWEEKKSYEHKRKSMNETILSECAITGDMSRKNENVPLSDTIATKRGTYECEVL